VLDQVREELQVQDSIAEQPPDAPTSPAPLPSTAEPAASIDQPPSLPPPPFVPPTAAPNPATSTEQPTTSVEHQNPWHALPLHPLRPGMVYLFGSRMPGWVCISLRSIPRQTVYIDGPCATGWAW
jgi:hypothetical protein